MATTTKQPGTGRRPAYERAPHNYSEAEAWNLLRASGWGVTKRGWPDFFCWHEGKICLVEVKPHRGRRLKFRQRQILEALAARGIPCYTWTPDGGFEAIDQKSDPAPAPTPEELA
jgi:hypothetical protein